MTFLRHRMMWTALLLVAVTCGVGVAQNNALPVLPAGSDEPAAGRRTPSSQPSSDMPANFSQPFAPPSVTKTDSVQIQYVIERPVSDQVRQGNETVSITRYVREVRSARIEVDARLDELDLPPDGKRAAVLAVTAARHDNLLTQLKEAKTDEEKTAATEALKANYTEHYAIETWWREQRLAELEARLDTMREQVKARQDSQDKYIDAAMTIAQLWAQGIAIAPPKPGSAPATGQASAPVVYAPSSVTPTPFFPDAGANTPPGAAPSTAPEIAPPAPGARFQ